MPASATEDGPADPEEGRNKTGLRQSSWGNAAFGLVVTGVLFLLLEGVAGVLMAIRQAKHTLFMAEEIHAQYDPELGWSNRPNLHFPALYGEGKSFTTNAQGFRAKVDYSPPIPPGRYRIVCLGDSFTMGYGVADDETYPAQLQHLCPVIQAVNMGQGGYGVDQDYLWYKRDGVKLQSQILLFGIIAHDFYRMKGREFIGYPKPALEAKGGRLAIRNIPVPRSWATRTPLRRLRTFADSLALTGLMRWALRKPSDAEEFYGIVTDEVFSAAALAFDDLADISLARGQRLVLVYLPSSDVLAREPTPELTWLAVYARHRGITLLDLATDFERLSPAAIARLFRADYHYSPEGNRFVADMILRGLRREIPNVPECGADPGSDPPEP